MGLGLGFKRGIVALDTSSAAGPQAPTLTMSNRSQFSGAYVIGDNALAQVTTADATDGFTTTGVNLYESGVLIAAMAQVSPGVWELTVSSLATGAKSYTARRAYSGGTIDSSAVAFTVLGALDPSQVTSATLLGWWRSTESITIGGTPVTTGTGPVPAFTFTGTRAGLTSAPFFKTHTAGAVGVGTIDIYLDGGTTAVETNVLIAANGSHTIAGGGGLAITAPASGTLHADNTWRGIANPFVSKLHGGTDDFVNNTAGQRPVPLNAVAADNNLPAIQFENVVGSNERLICTGSLANSIVGGVNTKFHGFVQCRVNTIQTNGLLLAFSHSTDTNIPLMQITCNTANNYQIQRRISGASNVFASSDVIPQPGYTDTEFGFDGTNAFLLINGTPVVGAYGGDDSGIPAPLSMAGTLTVNQICIGGRADQTGFSSPMLYQIYEIAFWNQPLDPVEAAQVRAYRN